MPAKPTNQPAVYLLHFTAPISANHTTQHYLGWAEDWPTRILQHRAGKSDAARLCQVAKERGIDFMVARIWPDGDRTLERKLKNRKEAPSLCPICRRRRHHHDQLPLLPSLEDEIDFYYYPVQKRGQQIIAVQAGCTR